MQGVPPAQIHDNRFASLVLLKNLFFNFLIFRGLTPDLIYRLLFINCLSVLFGFHFLPSLFLI